MQLLYLLVGIATTPQQNVQALDFFVGQVAQQGRDAKSLIQAVDSTSQQQYAEVVKRMTKEQREKLLVGFLRQEIEDQRRVARFRVFLEAELQDDVDEMVAQPVGFRGLQR